MSLQAEIDSALDEIRDSMFDDPNRRRFFTWKGAEIPCVVTGIADGSTVVVGGVERLASAKIFIKKVDMPGITVDMDTITVDSTDWTADNSYGNPTPGQRAKPGQTTNTSSRRYKIYGIRDLPSHYELLCLDANSGRGF